MSRFIAATGILLAVTAALVGCTEEEDPEPQWTEESAYAAAEETFRAYWAAGEEDPEGRFAYLTPEMREIERRSDDELQGLDIELRGTSEIESSQFVEFREVGETTVVEMTACVDGNAVEVRQGDGSWRSPREDPTYQVEVQLEATGNQMLIADLTESEADQC